ncbi:hypothetical protein IF1G_07948 [Cordyceps javanica]|uniref:Uncharacterized protein n=1 Tax=Cordyceps javanica TaxID=43265 RepID=A0A545VU88_9HYPO|nr:hypothetical protein IF1G_07948 [Cordyceps javanica]TQW05282.1 hypothetical protein IF2G_07219 [Cordyceps javanica]
MSSQSRIASAVPYNCSLIVRRRRPSPTCWRARSVPNTNYGVALSVKVADSGYPWTVASKYAAVNSLR